MNENDRKFFEDLAREEDKKVFVDYTNPRVKTNEALYGEGISRSNSVLYSTKDRITHLGFNNISDFDIAIREVKKDIKDYNILLEEHQDRIDEIDVILKNKNPEHDITGAIPKLNAELEDRLENAKQIIIKIEKEKKNLKELEAARKEFLNNKKSTYKNKTNDRLGTLDELSRAEKDLKDLEGKIYAGTINNFEKERYEVLKNEIIPELELKLNERSNQFKTEESSDDKSENDKSLEEGIKEEKTGDESNDSIDEKNENEKNAELENDQNEKTSDELSLDEKENEDEIKQENPIDKANLEPEKPKKVKILSKAGAKLRSAIEKNALKAVLGVAAGLAAIALIVTNPALLALVPAAKIGYDYNQGRKL